jgi:hypothetical protein
MRVPKSVEVGLDLKVFSLKGTWEPSNTERAAAWELYVELITRISVVPLHGDPERGAYELLLPLWCNPGDPAEVGS